LVRIYVQRASLDDARLALLDVGVQAPDLPVVSDRTPPAWVWIATAFAMIVVTLAIAYLNGLRTVL